MESLYVQTKRVIEYGSPCFNGMDSYNINKFLTQECEAVVNDDYAGSEVEIVADLVINVINKLKDMTDDEFISEYPYLNDMPYKKLNREQLIESLQYIYRSRANDEFINLSWF